MMRKYVVARLGPSSTTVLGLVEATDVVQAVERARRRFARHADAIGVLPWKAATREQRAEAKLQGQRKLGV